MISIMVILADLTSYVHDAWGCLGYAIPHMDSGAPFVTEKVKSFSLRSDLAPALQPAVEHVRDLFQAFVLNGREREYPLVYSDLYSDL